MRRRFVLLFVWHWGVWNVIFFIQKGEDASAVSPEKKTCVKNIMFANFLSPTSSIHYFLPHSPTLSSIYFETLAALAQQKKQTQPWPCIPPKQSQKASNSWRTLHVNSALLPEKMSGPKSGREMDENRSSTQILNIWQKRCSRKIPQSTSMEWNLVPWEKVGSVIYNHHHPIGRTIYH